MLQNFPLGPLASAVSTAFAFVLSVSATVCAAGQAVDLTEAIEAKMAELEKSGELLVGDRPIFGHHFVQGLYRLTDNRPIWSETAQGAFLEAVKSVYDDGLHPADYVFPEIASYLGLEQREQLSTAQRLEVDILFSEGLIRALYHLAYGKVDPVALDPSINFTRPLTGRDFAGLLVEHTQRADIASLLDLARPERPVYGRLKKALSEYRRIQADGGWPVVPEGKAIKPGDTDPRIRSLRERLSATGDYRSGGSRVSSEYDSALVEAVKRFQTRHGLEADGIVGSDTLAEMNVSVDRRINQIRVNLERLRWYMHELQGEYLLTDIAAFEVYWIQDGKIVWQKPVQVGKDYTETPVFKDEVEYIDFNPTWTVPPGIIRRSILPGLRKDAGYLGKRGFLLLTLDGKPVDPKTVDWNNIKGFPYLVRQPPGPDNALGRVKFMFPNPHFVFLHDTNHPELFNRDRRTFSSGCVRVKDPFELAERLLHGQQGWDRAKIDAVVESGKLTRVILDKKMPIIIAYITAVALTDEVSFRRDIYKRDPKVLAGLDGDFVIRQRDR
jgi:murein L,D-transpeptidase YcbB/YkuD